MSYIDPDERRQRELDREMDASMERLPFGLCWPHDLRNHRTVAELMARGRMPRQTKRTD